MALCKYLFWSLLELKNVSSQQPIPVSSRIITFSSDDIRISGGWGGFFLAATGAPNVPAYWVMTDDIRN